MAAIDKWLTTLAEIKQQEAELAEARKEVEEKIIGFLSDTGADNIEAKDGSIKATVVRSTTLKIDEDGLAKVLSAPMWRQISRRVLDQRALEDKVARGAIDVDVVAQHTTEVPRKPYLRLTERKA